MQFYIFHCVIIDLMCPKLYNLDKMVVYKKKKHTLTRAAEYRILLFFSLITFPPPYCKEVNYIFCPVLTFSLQTSLM